MIELIFVIVILGILAAVAVPRLAGVQDDALIAKEESGIGAIRSGVQAMNGKLMLSPGASVSISVYTEDGQPKDINLTRGTDYNNSKIINLSVNDAWTGGEMAQDEKDQTLAIVLDASSGRNAWTTTATTEATATNGTDITGPATKSVSDGNAKLNTNKKWVYTPASGSIVIKDK